MSCSLTNESLSGGWKHQHCLRQKQNIHCRTCTDRRSEAFKCFTNKPQQVFPWNIFHQIHPRQTSRSHFVLKGHSSCFCFFSAQLPPIAFQCLEQQMRHNCSASQQSTLRSDQWLVSNGLACGKPAQVSWPSETPSFPERLTSFPRVWRPQSSSSFIFHFSISKSKINLRVLATFLHRRKVMFTSWHEQVFLLTVRYGAGVTGNSSRPHWRRTGTIEHSLGTLVSTKL